MKLAKYKHACVWLEEQGQKLVIDPGVFTELPEDITGVVALVITHEHPDHFNPEHAQKIIAANPGIKVFAAKEVVSKLPGSVEPEKGKTHQAGPYSLEFYGEMHATIHPSYPTIHNLSVIVNGIVCYPGDSLGVPPKTVKTLLVPAVAPWTNIAGSMDLMTATKAPLVIPTHDGMLSPDMGMPIYDDILSGAAKSYGGKYQRLQTGESIEV